MLTDYAHGLCSRMDPTSVEDENGDDFRVPDGNLRERNLGAQQRGEKSPEYMVDEDPETDPGSNEGGQAQK